MNQKILTIAIPTYNRLDAIKKQIGLLLPQLNEYVDLVVYDNCSEPSVASVFSEEQKRQFKIIRNKVNVGADANIARCFEHCETKWLWTLSDDDFVRDESIVYLLSILESKGDNVFFNFQPGLSFRSQGFEEFSLKFRDPNVFSSSFTMSSCVYNIDELKHSLIDYYVDLSSMVGTIILVLKYLQRNDHAKCEFIDVSLIDDYNTEVGWDYRKFVRRSMLFVDTFRSSSSKKFNHTLFLGYFLTNYWLIKNNRNKLPVSKGERLDLLYANMRKQGIINAVRYCPRTVIRTIVDIIFN